MKPCQYHWDEMKIGPGAPPIKTPRGWLNIYHGVFPTMDGCIYRLGVALHDLHDPSKIIGVGDEWILQPEEPYEITGYVHNVVFCCGAVPEEDGSIKIYWGGADSVMCVGTANTEELVDHCLNNSRDPCKMKIAILSPIAWRTPPAKYGPWEQVASNIAEGLVDKGIDVTLFATGNSVTKGKLQYVSETTYSENPDMDPKVWECLHISNLMEQADNSI
jgi:hypothetical protein